MTTPSRSERLTDYEYDERCPECDTAWWLFPPAKIHGSTKGEVRCIECKSVYENEGRAALASQGEP